MREEILNTKLTKPVLNNNGYDLTYIFKEKLKKEELERYFEEVLIIDRSSGPDSYFIYNKGEVFIILIQENEFKIKDVSESLPQAFDVEEKKFKLSYETVIVSEETIFKLRSILRRKKLETINQ